MHQNVFRVDLANYLVDGITEHLDVRNSAFNTIHSKLDITDGYDSMQKAPGYFKLKAHVDLEDREIHIQLKDMPVANTGDGVATNRKAPRLLLFWD